MRYDKPHLTVEKQVELLRERGMGGSPDFIAQKLRVANYHRLAAYWHPYRLADHSFKPGTDFGLIWRLYVFDRRLRLLVLDAIERFEVSLRTQFAYHHTLRFGPFAYAEQAESLPKMTPDEHEKLRRKIAKQLEQQKHDPYFAHFMQKYGDAHEVPPLWAAVELMEFGQLMHCYQCAPSAIKRVIADSYGVPSKVLGSWVVSLLATRNICAHHGRLWNRVLGVRPKELPKERFPEWHEPHVVDMSRIYGTLEICRLLIRKTAPGSSWEKRLRDLIVEFPEVPLEWMGFPPGWRAQKA